jgi:SulP family sulfate permease
MIIFMPFAKLIPMATLAAILIVVAYNMSEWRAFKALLKSSKSDISVLVITFLLTVVFDLVTAIEFGMVLAMFLFIKKMSESTQVFSVNPLVNDSSDDEDEDDELPNKVYKEFENKLLIYEISGPLFFGAANTFLDVITEVNINADILILRMRNVPIIDATAFNVLKRIVLHCRRHHIMLIFSEVQQAPFNFLLKTGFVNRMGDDRFTNDFESAIKIAHEILDLKLKISGRKKAQCKIV